jgi:peptidoglycan/LPS O-acetylase OafA/YrhL
MPVFYVLAGFFAALLLERRGTVGFVRNRLLRVLVPFAAGWAVLFPLVAALAVAGASLSVPGASPLAAALRLFSSLGVLHRRPDPMHLWFLEYLLVYYAIAIVAVTCFQQLGGIARHVDRVFRMTVRSPLGPAMLAVLMVPVLLRMEAGAIDDPSGFVPEPRIVAAYAIFFGWGWLLWRNVECLSALPNRRRASIFVALGVVAALSGYLLWYWLRSTERDAELGLMASAWCLGLAMWLFIFGLMGLCIRFLDRPISWIRYVSDSSYWAYLVHMPVLLLFQIVVAGTDWIPALKAIVVFAASVATLLGSYHLLVRPTWVGRVLNGRRHPIGQPRLPAQTDIRHAH